MHAETRAHRRRGSRKCCAATLSPSGPLRRKGGRQEVHGSSCSSVCDLRILRAFRVFPSAVPTHNSIRARLDSVAVGNVRDLLDTTPGSFSVALVSFGSSPLCSGGES